MTFSINFNQHDQLDLSQLELASWQSDYCQTAFRQTALKRFQNAPLPSRKVEHWKYNHLFFLKDHAFTLTEIPCTSQIADITRSTNPISWEQSIDLTFVDGFLVTDLSQLPAIKGLTISSFAEANPEQQKIITQRLSAALSNKNMLLNLGSAIGSQGVLIQVAANTNPLPLIYCHYLTNANAEKICHQQLLVDLGSSSQLTLVEHFESANSEAAALSIQQTLINLADNAGIKHYRLNLENDSARQISQTQTLCANHSRTNSFYLGFGSQLNRTDVNVLHQGVNAECQITGIYLPAKQQNIDFHTNVEHQSPHCKTSEVFRGIVADQATATFNGKIHIFKDAQKSDAHLNNKNLLLTNQATVNTKPELEIYADDVSCAHGATVAQLDKKSLYYLQTRGISEQKAKKILSIGFIQELLNQIDLLPVKNYLMALLEQHMSELD